MKTTNDTTADTFGTLGAPIRPEPKPNLDAQKKSEFETYNWAPNGLRIKPSPAPQPGYSIGGVIVEEDADFSAARERVAISNPPSLSELRELWAQRLDARYARIFGLIKSRHSRDEQTDD